MTADDDRRDRTRALWASGDYAVIGDLFAPAGVDTVAELGVLGADLLDVATGTGNTLRAAVDAGARSVRGIDMTPELLEVARIRCTQRGIDAELDVGDAESLPYGDAAFDRVISTFGVMFAPDHRRAAAELMRVCRPGGRIAVTAWTPDGLFGAMTATLMGFLPVPPPAGPSPVQWADPTHVEQLFAGASVTTSVHAVRVRAESTGALVEQFATLSGPLLSTRAVLEQLGRWSEARAALHALYDAANDSADGTYAADVTYARTLVQLD